MRNFSQRAHNRVVFVLEKGGLFENKQIQLIKPNWSGGIPPTLYLMFKLIEYDYAENNTKKTPHLIWMLMLFQH